MCGILGAIPSCNINTFKSALNTLTHRGPDGFGIWQDENNIILGHRRLSILDLSEDGKQPMLSNSGRYCITYNGEVYNFIEIKKELESKGYNFKSDSDTEVVINAFEEWGPKFLDKLNGMWAMAIWDKKDKKLFLSRDRFGKKPLFYAIIGNIFYFASEMKAILPFLSEVKISKYYSWIKNHIYTYEKTDKCLIDGIKRFPAGYYGWLKDCKLDLYRYWCTLDNLRTVPSTYEDQVEEFKEIFLDACRIRMRSDVPVGTALSGGLDSSATISAMAYINNNISGERVSKDWQHAFVASFPGTPLDELKYAQKVTDFISIEPEIIRINPIENIDKLNEYLYFTEELIPTNPIPFIQLYKAMNKNKIKVTIDGHGADELFGGYFFDYVTSFYDAFPDINKINTIYETFLGTMPDDIQFEKPSKTKYFGNQLAKLFVKKLLGRNTVLSGDNKNNNWKKLDNLTKQLYISVHETVLPSILRNYDRYSMANSVEIRMPFMDHRIVSYAFSLPWNSKIRKGFSKAIIRDALSDIMPEEIAYRKSKIGFNSPVVDWMKGPLKTYFLDIMSSRDFNACDIINVKKTKKRIKNVINNPLSTFAEGEKAWTSIMPFFWKQALIDGIK